jgi:hypothetical protein
VSIKKIPLLRGGIEAKSCQNRRVILIYDGNGHDSTTLNRTVCKVIPHKRAFNVNEKNPM